MHLNYSFLLALFFILGCGNSKTLSYDFTQNGCKTGKHEFATLKEMCAALENDKLNNFCAQSMRQEYYWAQCRDK